jgi:hypothetical protein
MLKGFRVTAFLSFFLLMILSLSAQDAAGPASTADLDRELRQNAAELARRLNSLGSPTRVAVELFSFEGYETPLGSYWKEELTHELVNQPNQNFTLLNNVQGDYAVLGQILDMADRVRVFTHLVRASDSAIIASWTTDLGKTDFLLELLDTGSSSGSSVSRDRYETDSRENPQSLQFDTWVSRTIHNSSDQDWFRITSERSGVLILETDGNMDVYMELYSDAGELLDEDDDGGGEANSRIEFFADAGELYIVKVRGYSSDTGSYRFRASIEELDDDAMEPNETIREARPITLGEELKAFFHSADDVDWYRLELPSEGQLLVYTTGRVDTTLGIYDGNETGLADDDDSGEDYNARLSFPVSPGSLFIKVDTYEGERGAYTLHTELREPAAMDEFEPDNTASRAKTIAIGGSQRRTFSDGDDIDWVRFTVTDGGAYVISAGGENDDELDTYIEVFDGEEELVGEDDDSGPGYASHLSVQLDPGTYLIKVRTLDDDPADSYLLRVERD